MKRLLARQQGLHALGVKTLAHFGSVVRGDSGKTSDVDVVVELNRQMGLFGLGDLKHRIQQILGVKNVDLITRDNIHPMLNDVIPKEPMDVI